MIPEPWKLCRCVSCGEVWRYEQVVPLTLCPDLGERLSPGAEVPAGECPGEDCAAFCYLADEGE